MLKQNTSAELTYPAIVPLAVMSGGNFIIVAPIRVLHIRMEDKNTLCVFNSDGKFQRLTYSNPTDLAADFNGLRTIMQDTARYVSNMYWEFLRHDDNSMLLNLNPRDVTGFHTYKHPIEQRPPCSHHVTLDTAQCTVGMNVTEKEMTELSAAILDAQFGNPAQ